jgi:hypothetical protein
LTSRHSEYEAYVASQKAGSSKQATDDATNGASSDDEVCPVYWAVQGMPGRIFVDGDQAADAMRSSKIVRGSLMSSTSIKKLETFARGQ